MKRVVKRRVIYISKNPGFKKGQVWIETVVYTLIALVILGAVLSFAQPKIQELQDKSIIDQSINMLEDLENVVEDIRTAPGNKRKVELEIKKGSLTIDSENNKIIFEIESLHTYSEPCPPLPEECTPYEKGNIKIYNYQVGEVNKISAISDYSGRYNLVWNNQEKSELLTKSSAGYSIFISNEGIPQGDNKIKINFEF